MVGLEPDSRPKPNGLETIRLYALPGGRFLGGGAERTGAEAAPFFLLLSALGFFASRPLRF